MMMNSHEIENRQAKALGVFNALVEELMTCRDTIECLNAINATHENQDYSMFIQMDFDYFCELSRVVGQMMGRVSSELADFSRIKPEGEPVTVWGYPVVVVSPSVPQEKIENFKVVIECKKRFKVKK